VKISGKARLLGETERRALYLQAAAKHPDPHIRALAQGGGLSSPPGGLENPPLQESLHTCPKCGRGNFTADGLKRHVCRPKPEAGSRKPEVKANEHGVLPVTEEVVVPGLPKGCAVTIRLSDHQGCWYYGYSFLSRAGSDLHYAASAAPAVDQAKWTARWGALDAGLRQAIRWFEDEKHPQAVRVLAAFTEAQPDRFTDGTANSFGRLDPKAPAQSFRGAMPRSPKPSGSESRAPVTRHLSPVTTDPMSQRIPLHKRPVQFRPPGEFSVHEFLADDPWLAPKDPRLKAKEAAWREAGTFDPILALADGRIVAGRHRHRFSNREEWDEVPWIEVHDDEVVLLAMRDLFAHHPKSKSQTAYLAAPKLEPMFKAAQDRRITLLQSGGKARLPQVASPEDLAHQLGVSDELLRQARRIHEAFAWTRAQHGVDGRALRKEWEPKILDAEEPVNLGFVLAGIAGQKGTKGRPRKPARNSALNNALAGLRNLVRPVSHWEKWTDEERDTVAAGFRGAFTKLPAAALDVIAAAIRAAKKAQAAAPAEPTED